MPNRTVQFEFFTNDKLVRDGMSEEEATKKASKPNSEPQEAAFYFGKLVEFVNILGSHRTNELQ